MAERPRWTEPLTITVGVQNLWDLYRVLGLSGKRAVGGLAGGGCQERAEIVVAGACGEAAAACAGRPLGGAACPQIHCGLTV